MDLNREHPEIMKKYKIIEGKKVVERLKKVEKTFKIFTK